MMFSIAAAASRQCGFGAETEKRQKERQEEKRQQNARDRPHTQAVPSRRITTTNFLTRHKLAALYGAFLSSIIGNEKSCLSWSEVRI
jgi:hypothetical protein